MKSVAEYRHYLNSGEKAGFFALDKARAMMVVATENLDKRFEKIECKKQVRLINAQIRSVEKKILASCEDAKEALYIADKSNCLKVSVTEQVKCSNNVFVTPEDMDMLLAPLMRDCTLCCPCIQLDAETGEETRYPDAAKVCETRKLLQRIGLKKPAGTDTAFCPYWGVNW